MVQSELVLVQWLSTVSNTKHLYYLPKFGLKTLSIWLFSQTALDREAKVDVLIVQAASACEYEIYWSTV